MIAFENYYKIVSSVTSELFINFGSLTYLTSNSKAESASTSIILFEYLLNLTLTIGL